MGKIGHRDGLGHQLNLIAQLLSRCDRFLTQLQFWQKSPLRSVSIAARLLRVAFFALVCTSLHTSVERQGFAFSRTDSEGLYLTFADFQR